MDVARKRIRKTAGVVITLATLFVMDSAFAGNQV